jgi:hypothetical protein
MYALLKEKLWNNGKKYSIFAVPDIIDYTPVFGSWNPYDLALKSGEKEGEIQKAENIAKIEGMKEGALSAPITYFEKDWKTNGGAFVPKQQTNKISEIFQESAVIRETRYQTLNTLQSQLQNVESELKKEFSKSFEPKNINMFSNSPIKPADVEHLMKQKNKLQAKMGRVRIGTTLDTARNASQLIKGPETILTIADNFTIFDRNAYYDANSKGLNVHERINDIRTKGAIPRDLIPHFEVKELMGPPELIPTKNEALKRQMLNPLARPRLRLPPPNLDIPKSPLKAPYKNIQEASQMIKTPSKKLVSPSFLPDTALQQPSKLITQGKPKNSLTQQLTPEKLDEVIKRKPTQQQTTPPTTPTKKQTRQYLTSLSSTSKHVSPIKARLQSKLRQSRSNSPNNTPPSSSVKKQSVRSLPLNPQQQQQLYDKIKSDLESKYVIAKGTGQPSKEHKHKKHNQNIKDQLAELENSWNGDKSIFTTSEYAKYFPKI